MNRATPTMRDLAKDLLLYQTSNPRAALASDVIEKLRSQLTNLLGNGGFRALLSRALVLAKAEVSWLDPVQVKADGNLEGLEELQSQLNAAEFLEGNVVLLAQLLGLLVAFIGTSLSSRLVKEIWPKFNSKKWASVNTEVQIE